MPNNPVIKPLGLVLQKADLISKEQIETALQSQQKDDRKRIGEILASFGWIKPETADFFAQQWPQIVDREWQQPLGQYFKKAGLLNEEQIKNILLEQKNTGNKFGEIAVSRGWIKPTTVNFFIEQIEFQRQWNLEKNYFISKGISANESQQLVNLRNHIVNNQHCDPIELLALYKQVWQQKSIFAAGTKEEAELVNLGLLIKQNNQLKIAKSLYQSHLNTNWIEQELAILQPYSKIKLKLLNLEGKASLPYKVLTEVFFWTGNQPFLTQKLCQLINEKEFFIPVGAEAARIEELVQEQIIDNWQKQAAAEHLQEINDRLLNNENCRPERLLKLYQQIWQQGEVSVTGSQEEQELQQTGLILKEESKLKLANRIYHSVFNQAWISENLSRLIALPPETDRKTNSSIVAIKAPSTPKSTKKKSNKPLLAIFLIPGIGLLLGLGFFGLGHLFFSQQHQEKEFFQQGNELLKKEKYQKALDRYNQVLRLDGNHYEAWTNRGYALGGLQKYNSMLESCTSATIIYPTATYAWNCQGEAHLNLKDYNRALAAFDRAISLEPNEPVFLLNKGETLISLQKVDEAMVAIDQAIDLLEDNQKQNGNDAIERELTIALSNKGKALRIKQRNEEAIAVYNQALEYSPNYLTARQGKGIALTNLKRYEEARQEFDRILAEDKFSDAQKAEIWFYQGLNYCRSNQKSEAIVAFDEALKIKPNYQAAAASKLQCQPKVDKKRGGEE